MAAINTPTTPLSARQSRYFKPNTLLLALSSLVMAVSVLASIGFVILGINLGDWRFAALAVLYVGVIVVSTMSINQVRSGRYSIRTIGLLSSFLAISFFGQSFLIKGAGLPSALIFILFSLILTSIISEIRSGTGTILSGLLAASLMSLLGAFSPYATIKVPIIDIFLASFLAIALMGYIAMLAVQYISSTLQLRLTTAFIAIVIVSLSVSTIVETQVAISELRDTISSNVVITSSQVARNLDNFFDTNIKAVQQEAQLDPLIFFLDERKNGSISTARETNARMVFKMLQFRETAERVFLSSYALLDQSGINVLDTTESNRYLNEGSEPYFTEPMKTGTPYISDVVFPSSGYSYVYLSAPVVNRKQERVGVLRVRYNALVLQRILETNSGLLGINSHAILVDEHMIRLADTFTPDNVYTPVVNLTPEMSEQLATIKRLPNIPGLETPGQLPEFARALQNSERSSAFSANLEPLEEGEEADQLVEIGGISGMAYKPWKLVYLQAEFDDSEIRDRQVQIATLVATIIAMLVGFISVAVSNFLSAPITSLTHTAERIAKGDLNTRSKVLGNDEFGTLGRSFNQMADQLRNFIAELENRVAERTQEIAERNEDLVFRSRQLQTVAEVARSIVTSQELEPLLLSVTRLISERFNFYHVGVFLLDENREYAVLRAANSEGGQRMLARQHMLKVGKIGIVGHVTSTGEPRIATDVGEDSVFFNNPDLPQTRSEMAIALKMNNQIIGALDVQSTEANAFSENDIELFTTLADQVAVAIYNNHLFTETSLALSEAQRVHRQYLRQEWDSDLLKRQRRAFQYTPQGIANKEMDFSEYDEAIRTGEPYIQHEEQPDHSVRATMVVPVLVRGELIGAIRMQDVGANRSWSENELQTVKDVAQQVGVALESARLLEKTVLRAEREKKVLEITSMIRSSTDPQEMIEIAAQQLQKALGASYAQISIHQPESKRPHASMGNGSKGNGHSPTEEN